jgi:hypothetical protein
VEVLTEDVVNDEINGKKQLKKPLRNLEKLKAHLISLRSGKISPTI